MKWLLITLGFVFAMVMGITGLLRMAVTHLAGEEVADTLWATHELPIIYMGIIMFIIVVLAIKIKMQSRGRGRQTVGGG